MKIVTPTAELVTNFNGDDVLKLLETCARVSHKSESKGNSTDFIRKIIKLGHESVLEHFSATFHIICDRAIQNELVRHRHASFTVESTRYIKYDELPVIRFQHEHVVCYDNCLTCNNKDCECEDWFSVVKAAEDAYKDLRLPWGFSPQFARAVLPLCLATELYMTANLREWRHILKLRTSKAAHPQMQFIANKILSIFKKKIPVVFEDIRGD